MSLSYSQIRPYRHYSGNRESTYLISGDSHSIDSISDLDHCPGYCLYPCDLVTDLYIYDL